MSDESPKDRQAAVHGMKGAAMYLAMRLQRKPAINIPPGVERPITLPEGCCGIMFVYETAEDARRYEGPDVLTAKVEIDEREEDETPTTR